jgi:hypothetical protein
MAEWEGLGMSLELGAEFVNTMTGEEGQGRVQDTATIDVESARESLEYSLQGLEMHLPRLRKEPNFSSVFQGPP